MESRLTDLETKISFAEELLEALNRTVYEQQQQIDQLQRELRALREQVQTGPPAEPGDTPHEVPPHY